MSRDSGDRAAWKVEVISPDDRGCRFYLDHYKSFRLTALQQDPDAFGSTYAREISFTDDDWLSRLKNPLAYTYVAVRLHDQRVLSATSLLGPLRDAEPASNPTQVAAEMINAGDQPHNHHHHTDAPVPVFFQMTGVYTSPDARGRGIARTLVKLATECANEQARQRGRPLALSVVVYASNHVAISFYESCGFEKGAEGPKKSFNTLKNTTAEELGMYYYSPGRTPSPLKSVSK